MGPLGCLAYDQCPDGPMPMMWQCSLSASSTPVEIEGSAYMAALPFAKTGQCLKVQTIALAWGVPNTLDVPEPPAKTVSYLL